jgi:hypothetical protein
MELPEWSDMYSFLSVFLNLAPAFVYKQVSKLLFVVAIPIAVVAVVLVHLGPNSGWRT